MNIDITTQPLTCCWSIWNLFWSHFQQCLNLKTFLMVYVQWQPHWFLFANLLMFKYKTWYMYGILAFFDYSWVLTSHHFVFVCLFVNLVVSVIVAVGEQAGTKWCSKPSRATKPAHTPSTRSTLSGQRSSCTHASTSTDSFSAHASQPASSSQQSQPQITHSPCMCML